MHPPRFSTYADAYIKKTCNCKSTIHCRFGFIPCYCADSEVNEEEAVESVRVLRIVKMFTHEFVARCTPHGISKCCTCITDENV